MMQKEPKNDQVTAYTFTARELTNVAKAQDILRAAFKTCPIGTYGGVSTDTLYETITKRGYPIEREEICAKDDEDVGLHMPNFWPINLGGWAMSIAMYYSYMQMRYNSGFPTFPEWNRTARKDLGWISTVEVYHIPKLLNRLEENQWPFFSSPLTLTECMRYLEGWQMERLQAYREYSQTIETWAKTQPFYDGSEWHLGREQSKTLMQQKGRPTNVRLCIKRFWQEELTKRPLQESDRELDIVTPNFAPDRQPNFILLGEDFFELDGRFAKFEPEKHQTLTFNYNFQAGISHDNPIKREYPLEHQLATAQLASNHHSQTQVITLSYSPDQRRLFKLIKEDGIKEGTNLEVVLASVACLDSLVVTIMDGVAECLL